MVGVILVGHGNFSKGLISSMELIAGKHDFVEPICFDGGSIEKLEKDMKKKVEKMKKKHQKIIFLTDITGGSPFQVASKIAYKNRDISVIGGVNVGLLIEVVLTRTSLEHLAEKEFNNYIEELVNKAKDSIKMFEIIDNGGDDF